jgi:hypothetical protein
VRQRQPARLDPWLECAATSALEALQRFAKGLYEDYDAVKAGVTLPWSTGPMEGQINRLNMLKRQMFGRARLDLLSRRFVRALGGGQECAPAGPWRPSHGRRDGHGAAPRLASSMRGWTLYRALSQRHQMCPRARIILKVTM